MSIAAFCRRRPLLAFFVLAYALAWLAWAPLVLSQAGLGWLPVELSLWWTLPGSYAPLLAALFMQRVGGGGIGPLLPSLRGFALGLGLGAALLVLGFVVLPALCLAAAPPTALHWGALAAYPYATLRALLMAGPIGEEPGWRGYAWPRLQARYGALPATLILGSLWAGWHLPLFLVPQWNGSPPWIYALLVLGFAFVLHTAVNRAGGSVIVAIVLHAMFNASSAVLGGLLADLPIRDGARPDLVLALSFALVALLLAGLSRGRLGGAPPQP